MNAIDDLPLSLQISKRLEDDIIYGVFPLGAKLDEAELSARYGVSRTPIREALKLLAAEGLVEIRPRRGAIIPTVDPMKLFEMFEVMAELEAMCGRLACRRITDDQKQTILALHEACRGHMQVGNSETYYEVNRQFHEAIYHASHNHFLIEQTIALHKRLHPYRRLQLRVSNRMENSFAEHQAILDALFAHDEAQVETLLKAHVVIQGQKFSDFMATIEQLKNGQL